MHDVEWVDSGDCGSGDEDEAICAVLFQGAELEAATEMANDALAMLTAAIERAKQ